MELATTDVLPISERARSTSSVRLLVATVAVTVVAFVLFDHAPVSLAGGDSLWVVHTSASMISDQDLDLSEYSPLIDGYAVQPPPHLLNIEVQRLQYFPWGASLLAAPFVIVVALVTNVTGGDFARDLETTLPLFEIENDVASLIGAVTVGLLLLLMYVRLRSVAWAAALALVFAFGTGVMSTTTRAVWIQGPGLLTVVLMLLLAQLLSDRRGQLMRVDVVAAAAAGLLVVLAYATRPPLALLGPVLLVVTWRRGRWVAAGAFVGAATIALVAFVVTNVQVYGDILPPYYRDRLRLSGTFFNAFAANLVSPGRGLFIWSPMLIGGVILCLWRWTQTPVLDRLLLVWIGGHLVAMSVFPHWWAGASVGPRLMLDVVPALFVLFTPVVASMRSSLGAGTQRPLAIVVAACVVWACFVNVRAGYRMSVMLWNWPSPRAVSIEDDPNRVWDWSDPQFLR